MPTAKNMSDATSQCIVLSHEISIAIPMYVSVEPYSSTHAASAR